MEMILDNKYFQMSTKSIIYIVLGIIIYTLIRKFIKKPIKVNNSRFKVGQNSKINTLRALVLNIIKYLIVIIVILAILSTWGINVTSIVAGLGITTAIIGLAFQDLAKDLIAGFSIITESQYEVGDTIKIDDFMGEVISIGLKTTKIRDYKGATYIVANHNITKVINYSLADSLAVIDVSTAYEEESSKVEEVLDKMKKELKEIPNATGDLEILGINDLADSSVVYRITVPVKATKQFETERYLRKQIKDYFKKNNISIPYNQIEVHNGK